MLERATITKFATRCGGAIIAALLAVFPPEAAPGPARVRRRLRLLAVGRAYEHDRPRAFAFGQVKSGRELYAVAHGDHLLRRLRRLRRCSLGGGNLPRRRRNESG